MNKQFAFIFLVFAVLFSCKNSKPKETGNEDQKKNFFPVLDYLKSEIHYVDSLPLGITKYSTIGNKTDTAYIKSPEFDKFADDFLSTDLEPQNFEKEFSETSFMDETTHSATFTYATKNSKLELQRVDVLANTIDGANKVSSIYLEKKSHKNDTLIVEKLLWRTRTSFQIATSTQVSIQPPIVKQLKLVWGTE